MPEIDPSADPNNLLAVTAVDEIGYGINRLGQHVNDPIEKTRRFFEEKGKGQKGKIAEGESILPRLSEAQKQLATLGAGLVAQSLKVDQLEETIEKFRTDLKTLAKLVSEHSDRLAD